jgi:hypothetical protein
MKQRKFDLWALEDIPPENRLSGWPEDAREMLLDVLRDEHAPESDLYIAGRLLCEIPRVDDRWVQGLLPVLQNSTQTERARARAAVPLGPVLEAANGEGFDEGHAPVEEWLFYRTQDTLYAVYADTGASVIVRRRALEAFAHAPEPRLERAIRAAYAADESWRITALRCMFFHDGFETEILESLDSANLDIRSRAISAAGPAGLEEAWPHIRAVLSDPSSAYKPLLLAAIDSIGHIHPEEAQGFLEDLVSSGDEDVARAASRAIDFVLWPLAHYSFGDDAQH